MTGAIHPYDDLKAYCDGELTLTRRLAVRLHLARCASCREEVMSMRQLENELRPSDPVPLDPALRARILAEAASTPPSGRAFVPHSRRVSPLQLAATLGAAVVLAAVIGGPFALRSRDIVPTAPRSPVKVVRVDPSPRAGRVASASHASDSRAASRTSASANVSAVRPPQPMKPNALSSPSMRRVQSGFSAEKNADAPKYVKNLPDARSMKKTAIRRIESTNSVASVSVEPSAAITPPVVLSAVPAPLADAPPPPMPIAPLPPAPPAPPEAPVARRNFATPGPAGVASVDGVAPAAGPGAKNFALAGPRSVFSEATLTLQVKDSEAGEKAIRTFIRALGGSVESSAASTDKDGVKTASVVLTAPAKQFDPLVAWVSNLGSVTAKRIDCEDITQKISDATQAQHALELQSQQSQAGALQSGQEHELEDRAHDLNAQLAQMQARLSVLRQEATQATVMVTLVEAPPPAAPAQSGASPKPAALSP